MKSPKQHGIWPYWAKSLKPGSRVARWSFWGHCWELAEIDRVFANYVVLKSSDYDSEAHHRLRPYWWPVALEFPLISICAFGFVMGFSFLSFSLS